MNADRLRAVADAIEAHAKHFWMGSWMDFHDDDLRSESPLIAAEAQRMAETRELRCGTTMCVAGWAVLLFAEPSVIADCVTEKLDWEIEARKLLDMRRHKGSSDLFYVSGNAGTMAERLRRMASEAESPGPTQLSV